MYFQTDKDGYARTLEEALLFKIYNIDATQAIKRSEWINLKSEKGFVFEYRKELKSIYDKVLNFDIDNSRALELFNEYINIFKSISAKIEKELPLLSHALNIFVEEKQSIENYVKFDFISPMDDLWNELDGVLVLQRDLHMRLEELSQEQLNSQDRRHLPVLADLGNFNINMELGYSNGELKQIYLVNSAEMLYSLLTSYFFASKQIFHFVKTVTVSLCRKQKSYPVL